MRPLIATTALLLAACGSAVPPSGEANMSVQALSLPAPTGNQDRDFARTMVAYHQGAMDLARRQMSRGSDPALRQIAAESIAAREREIARLNSYLDRTGGR